MKHNPYIMSRPLRVQYPNALYHVMNRGADKQWIYQNDDQRNLFLSLLEEIHFRYKIEIHAYCLMDNHYHLLVKTPLANLDRGMRHLNGVYTQRYNQLMGKDGPLFRGRYRAYLIEAENYLIQVSRYIHLNPVAAQICKQGHEYCWSSYKYFLGMEQPPTWLKLIDTLQFFDVTNQQSQYQQFVENQIKNENIEITKIINKLPILGSDVFIKTVTEHFLKKSHKVSEIPMHKTLPIAPKLPQIKSAIINFFNITNEALFKKKSKVTNYPRLIALYLAVKLTHEKNQAIGDAFGGISGNAVTHAYHKLRKKLASDKKLARTVSDIEKNIYL